MFRFHYLNDEPIVSVEKFAQLGGNINGPSLIEAPSWLDAAPGKYLLYFAHHEGQSIRLAFSDSLIGPWQLHDPDPLCLADSLFATRSPEESDLSDEARAFIATGADGVYPHIASPDVWVDQRKRQLRLYYHGRMHNGIQRTRVALSRDVLNFESQAEILGLPYFRIFRHDGWFYAIAMPGQLYRSRDGLTAFEPGPLLTAESIRHHALLRHRDQWFVFWSRVGDTPECILVSILEISGDWKNWHFGHTRQVHRAQRAWEGADLPAVASEYGAVNEPVNQLRDPAIYEEDGKVYLLFATAGEQGIAIGQLEKSGFIPVECG